MTHPTREEWMSFLYDESPAESRASLKVHLNACAECRAQVTAWQQASRELNKWTLPRQRRAASSTPLMRWAIAAAVVGLAILGSVRMKALNDDVGALRAEIESNRKQAETTLRQQIAEQMHTEIDAALAQLTGQAAKTASAEARSLVAAVVQKLEEKRVADQQTTLAALQNLSAQRVADYASFRKELETVAVFTEAGLQRTQNQIATLADSSPNFTENK